MRLLLDTHALIWWVEASSRLSAAANDAIGDPENEIFTSAASAYELTYKHQLGKLPEMKFLAQHFTATIEKLAFVPLSLSIRHAEAAGLLDIPHKDPFDRMLIAQAQIEGLTLVSNETLFDNFGVRRLW